MRAVILAGGEGTRLRPLTDTTPKPLLPICNRPFLEHQIRWMASHGVTEADLLTGYLADAFEPFVAAAPEALGVELRVEREREPLGTAGAVRAVLDRLETTTLVFNGDVLTDLDLGALLRFHRERRAALTIALTPVADAGPYGLVLLRPGGAVERFLEKPPPEVARAGGPINAGTYVLEPRLLAGVPPGVAWSFEHQVFPALVERGEAVFGWVSDAYWLDIGTHDRYRQAHRDALDGGIAIEMAGERAGDRSLVGPGASVGEGARLGPHAVLGPGVRIGAGAAVEDSVMLEGASVGDGASVRGSILGRGAAVGERATVSETALGDGERS